MRRSTVLEPFWYFMLLPAYQISTHGNCATPNTLPRVFPLVVASLKNPGLGLRGSAHATRGSSPGPSFRGEMSKIR